MAENHFRHDEPRSIKNLNSFSAVLLALFTIVAFTANTFLVVTISTSVRLRNCVINYFLLHIAVVDLIDTMFNMVFTLIYISMGVSDWTLGGFFCDLNAFFGQIVTILTLGGLTLLSVDRSIALMQMAKYKETFTPIRAGATIGVLYIIALCFTTPILANSIKSEIYHFRYFCSIAEENDVIYVAMLLLFCYIFPLIVILCAFGIIFLKARLDRMHKRPSSDMRFTSDHIVEARRFQQNLLLSKFVVAIIILFILIQGPYIVLNFIGLLRNSRQVLKSFYDTRLEFPSDAETGLTWLKFVFPVVYPFLVFGFCKDIWKKFQDLICCRRSNMIRSAKTAVSAESSMDNVDTLRADTMEGTRVPTLVATAGGLHLRTTQYDDDGRMAADEYAYADLQHRSAADAAARRRSRNRFDALEAQGATSDYDSEDSQSWADVTSDVNRTGAGYADASPWRHDASQQQGFPETGITGDSVQPYSYQHSSAMQDNFVTEGNMQKKRMQVVLPEQDSIEVIREHGVLSDSEDLPGPSTKKHTRANSDSVIPLSQSNLPKPILKQANEPRANPGSKAVTLDIAGPSTSNHLQEPEPLHYSDFSSPEKDSEEVRSRQTRPSASVRLPPIPKNTTVPQKVNDIHKLDLGSLNDSMSSGAGGAGAGTLLNQPPEPSLGRYSNRISPDAAANYVADINRQTKDRRKSKSHSDIVLNARVNPAPVEYRKTVSADVMNVTAVPVGPFKKRKFRPQPLGEAPQGAWQQ